MANLDNPQIWLISACFLAWFYRAWCAVNTLRFAPNLGASDQGDAPAKNLPMVSIIIPAKNESANIKTCLDHLLKQKHCDYEILVANDNSTDNTEEILKSYGSQITYFNVPPTPPNWTGKNFALHEASKRAQGQWFLFTDADTRHSEHSASSSLKHAIDQKLDFLTLLPQCLTNSFFERLLQPFAMSYLGLWFPIYKINDPKKKLHFGNGQYILMRKKFYQKIGGHLEVKDRFLEDFALFEQTRLHGGKAECAFGMKLYGTRMYQSFSGSWRGWRRIFLHAYKQKPFPLFTRFLSILFCSVLPFTILASIFANAPNSPSGAFAMGSLIVLVGFILVISWQAYGMLKAERIYCIFHPISAVIIAMILLDASWMAMTKQKTVWR